MEWNKPILIMSTPRSGSHFLGHILGLYFTRKTGLEYGFNHVHHKYRKRELRRRYDTRCIYHSHFHYYFNSPPDDIECIKNKFDIILCTRRDAWKSFLSYYVGNQIKIFQVYKPDHGGQSATDNIDYIQNNIHRNMFKIGKLTKSRRREISYVDPRNADAWTGYPHIVFEEWIKDPLDRIPEFLPGTDDIKSHVMPDDIETMNNKMPYPYPIEELFENIDELKKELDKYIK